MTCRSRYGSLDLLLIRRALQRSASSFGLLVRVLVVRDQGSLGSLFTASAAPAKNETTFLTQKLGNIEMQYDLCCVALGGVLGRNHHKRFRNGRWCRRSGRSGSEASPAYPSFECDALGKTPPGSSRRRRRVCASILLRVVPAFEASITPSSNLPRLLATCQKRLPCANRCRRCRH